MLEENIQMKLEKKMLVIRGVFRMKELTISLEDDMFDTITKMAEKKGRTMSGEVTQLLKVALSNDFFTRVFRI